MVDLFDREMKFDVQKHKIQFYGEIINGKIDIPQDVLKRMQEIGVDTSSIVITLGVYDGSKRI